MVETTITDDRQEEDIQPWRIEPTPTTPLGQIAAMWRCRRLFRPLAVSALFDIYRQAILGIVWMVIRPLMIAVPAIFIVGNVFGISVDPVPLPLFIMVGLAIWILFRFGVQWTTKGLARGRGVLQRVYVPALLLVVVGLSPGFFQFGVVLSLVAGLLVYYGPVTGIYFLEFTWHTVAVIPALLMMVFLAISVSSFASILNIFASDTWLTLRYSLGAWLLLTPVLYPIEIIPEGYRWIAYLNPATVPVELFRWALLGHGGVPWPYIALSVAEISVFLGLGLWFFSKMQARIFDHL